MNKTIWTCIITGLLLYAYYPIVDPLFQRFEARDSYYSHGYLVPFVTAYLIWRKRKELAAITPQGSFLGLPLLILGLCVYVVSYFLEVNFTAYASCIIVIFGAVLFLGGWQITRVTLFPLLFLIFMIPLPEVIILSIAFEMKLFASQISSWMTNLVGIETSVSGSRIFYPGGFLWVGDPCSGLRSLISFLALGTVVVQLASGSIWKKGILFTSVIPIALLSNVVRIFVLTLASYFYGSQIIDGFLHDFMGFMVFVIGFIGLITLMNILKCHLSLETA
ncbi:MAG: exosortase [Cryomorphaceae bacterium]|jgi:exosortase